MKSQNRKIESTFARQLLSGKKKQDGPQFVAKIFHMCEMVVWFFFSRAESVFTKQKKISSFFKFSPKLSIMLYSNNSNMFLKQKLSVFMFKRRWITKEHKSRQKRKHFPQFITRFPLIINWKATYFPALVQLRLFHLKFHTDMLYAKSGQISILLGMKCVYWKPSFPEEHFYHTSNFYSYWLISYSNKSVCLFLIFQECDK